MSKSLTTLTAAAALCLVAPCAPAAEPAKVEATLKVDAPGAVISRHIYGQFSEHLGSGIYDGVWVGESSPIPNVRGIRSDVVQALKAIKVPVIRWPGGCFADEYRWRDGVGPRSERPSRKNNWWGAAPETNQFGTHEFMDFVEQVGSEAYVSVNVGSSNPTEMREWIEYMTSPGTDTLAQERRKNGREAPWKVAFWGIGNESWGCGGNMTPETYATELRRFSAFFHKSEDNNGLRVGSGSSGSDVNWTDVVMKSAEKNMDALSLHYYTLPTGDWGKKGAAVGFGDEQWLDTFAQTLSMDEFIPQHLAAMDKHDAKKRVALYIDEWGAWYDVEPGTNPGFLYQQNTLRDGVLAAANFNIFHKYADRVKMTNIAQTINVLQAMILTKGAQMVRTPTYYAYQMYVPFQDATSIPVDVTAPTLTVGGKSIPAFNLSAAMAKDGHLHIGIANMNPREGYSLSLKLGALKAKSVSGVVLTSNELDTRNVPGEPERIAPVAYRGGKVMGDKLELSLPARSVVVVRLD